MEHPISETFDQEKIWRESTDELEFRVIAEIMISGVVLNRRLR